MVHVCGNLHHYIPYILHTCCYHTLTHTALCIEPRSVVLVKVDVREVQHLAHWRARLQRMGSTSIGSCSTESSLSDCAPYSHTRCKMYACTYIPLEVGLAPLVALGWGAASLSTSGSRGCRGSHKRDPVKCHTPHWDRGTLDQRHSALHPVDSQG